jgi:hypothetical protein
MTNMNAANDGSVRRWQFRIAGCFWIIYGVAGCAYYSAQNWRDILDGRIVSVLALLFCALLAASGYGLMKRRPWSKVLCGLLLTLGVLFLLDMLAMSAFVGNYNALFFVGFISVEQVPASRP